MLDYLFGAASFLPHGYCLAWRPDLVALHVVSDVGIGLAYFSIPIAILAFLRRKPDFEYRWVAYLFAAFIVLCGLTHFAAVAMLWFPYYGLDGMLKAVTGGVSILTATLLWPLLPKVLALPSPRMLAETNARLEAEIAERRAAEDDLRRARDELEFRVAERTAELARSEERTRLAAEAGDVGTWDLDLATGRIERSGRLDAMFGLDSSQPFPLDAFFARIHPEDRDRVRARLDAALVSGDYAAEYRIVRPDGAVRWIEARGRVFRALIERELKPMRLMGAAVDVTERMQGQQALRASLAEKETLLREVHHRVKNNLQSLLALLQMERRRFEDPALAARFDAMRARIEVMAGIHESLYGSDTLSSVDMGAQIAALCRSTAALGAAPDRVAITPDVEPLYCSIETAVPLGVLANELVTNAAKHAFPGGRPGRIEVALRREADGVMLTVRDDGIGDCGADGGLGKRLVQALARQLRAVVVTTVEAGTTVRVALPAEDFEATPSGGSAAPHLSPTPNAHPA